MKNSSQPIDIVITWVDGSDPALRKKRMQYQDSSVASNAYCETRFANNNEIYYNILSILKYVPFCRYIYIVTDNQQPEFIESFTKKGLCSADKIRIVDHQEVFSGYKQYLPTFNPRAIESMLWNIQGLSDYFIFLNDDFFFNAPLRIEDILEDQKIVVYGHWSQSIPLKVKLKYRQILNKYFGKKIQPGHTVSQMLAADMLGFQRFFKVRHYPHVVDRKVLQDYFLINPEALKNQLKYRFRNINQVNIISLMNHLKIKKDEAILKPEINIAYLRDERSLEKFFMYLNDESVQYGCMQSLDQIKDTTVQRIYTALNHKLDGAISDILPDLGSAPKV